MGALLTVAAVAAELCVTPGCVRASIHAGELRAVRIGRGFRIRRDWLDAFIASREVRPAASAAPPVVAPLRRRGAPLAGAPFRSFREVHDAVILRTKVRR